MKKLFSILLILALSVAALTSCNTKLFKDKDGDKDATVIRIGFMEGPTGMGMAKLIHDYSVVKPEDSKYQFAKFKDAKDATNAIIAGSIDIACLPTNNAATIYNTKDAVAQVLAINCLNSLFLMTKSGTTVSSFEELEGKTIYTISNGTPKVILEHALSEKGINATVSTTAVINGKETNLAQPSDLASALIAGAVDIALVPEPVATAAPLKIKAENKDYSYSVAIDLDSVWSEISDTPVAMGCIVGRTEFVKNNKEAVNAFLDEYKASIEYISNKDNLDSSANLIVEATVLGAVTAAKKSLTNLLNAIAYKDGSEMTAILKAFYGSINVNLIGGKLPDDNFYYQK
ncbi:MAG: ABC transporter substrate-binding protein [Ruminococcaceae bacterium]|nr:ABC transporter substrate-binding protein [Oscillospiraceae bacterium]